MPFCLNHPKERVIFYCQDSKCANFEKQRLYCLQCIDQDDPPHYHPQRTIASLSQDVKGQWRTTRQSIGKMATLATEWFKIHEGLCLVLEQFFQEGDPQSENPGQNLTPGGNRFITREYEALQFLKENIEKFHETIILPLEVKEDLLSIKNHNGTLAHFGEELKLYEHLSSITSFNLWEYFGEVIPLIDIS